MVYTDFDKRMKSYEDNYRFLPGLPVIARLDGKCFSKFTNELERPFDERVAKIMEKVTVELVKESQASIGYTQSDEMR